MNIRRIRALVRKESLQIIRDPSSILIGFILPILLLFLYAVGVSLDLDHLRIGLVLEDTSPTAQSFAKALTNSPYFDVTIARDLRSIQNKLIGSKLRGIVVVPSYFSSWLSRPDRVAPIQVIADGSETNTAHFVQNYVEGAFATWLAEERMPQGLINIEQRFWYNEPLESRYFLLPGSLAIIMTLIGTLLTALVIAREWERGTMEALMATPVTIWEIIFSKLLTYFCFALISMVLCVLQAVLIYGVPFQGSFLLLLLVSSIFLCAALGIGLLISTLSKNQIVASQVAITTAFLPAYILSGFLFEISSMPKPIQWLSFLMPARYFVQCLQTLFLAGNIWKLILWNLVPMTLFAVIIYLFTAFKTVKRLD